MAMPEIEGAAVEMQVDQPLAGHVVDEIALAPADHDVDAEILPGLRLPGIPISLRPLEELFLAS
jgi:hypothetical protein